MSKFLNLFGTNSLLKFFKIGIDGVWLQSTSQNALSIRNSSNTADANLTAANVTAGVVSVTGNQLIIGNGAYALIAPNSGTSPITIANQSPTFIDASFNSSISGSQTIPATTFTTLSLPTINLDTSSAYNNATFIYTIPTTGLYQCISKLRLADNTPGMGYGQGIHTSNIDGDWFSWWTTVTTNGTNNNKNGSINIRSSMFNAGDQLRMYCYLQSSANIAIAEMSILKIG